MAIVMTACLQVLSGDTCLPAYYRSKILKKDSKSLYIALPSGVGVCQNDCKDYDYER